MDEKEFDYINVIPLVDVMLVLLTIVLTTSTFIATGALRVELPKATKSPAEIAKTLTIEFVQSLVQALGGRVQAEFLPDTVLARTERRIAWWTPPQKRPMFFGTTQGDMAGMNGAIFPQPALVWLAMDHSLSIQALKENRRPLADTKLCVAPYWNVYDTGSVCLGSMRAPDASTVASIPQWEQSFYESEFTHGNVGRLTRHSGGFEGLWKELAGKEEFPADSLIELPETVEEFLSGKRRGHDQ